MRLRVPVTVALLVATLMLAPGCVSPPNQADVHLAIDCAAQARLQPSGAVSAVAFWWQDAHAVARKVLQAAGDGPGKLTSQRQESEETVVVYKAGNASAEVHADRAGHVLWASYATDRRLAASASEAESALGAFLAALGTPAPQGVRYDSWVREGEEAKSFGPSAGATAKQWVGDLPIGDQPFLARATIAATLDARAGKQDSIFDQRTTINLNPTYTWSREPSSWATAKAHAKLHLGCLHPDAVSVGSAFTHADVRGQAVGYWVGFSYGGPCGTQARMQGSVLVDAMTGAILQTSESDGCKDA